MKITDIRVETFRTYADRWDIGHARLIHHAEVLQSILTIDTDEGVEGYYFGGGAKHGDQEGLNSVERDLILGRIKNLLVGQDPFDREMIWKWFWVANIPEGVASVIDMALWDIRGKAAGMPLYRLLGGWSNGIRTYAGGLSLGFEPPEKLADEALGLVEKGFRALKLRAGDTLEMDLARARKVRESLPDSVSLMIDANTLYSLEECRIAAPRFADPPGGKVAVQD